MSIRERIRLVKAEGETDPSYGKPPEERTISELLQNGVINLDKPSGPTSHQVTAWAREILELKKIGHGGTLDPRVTGVLPLALENCTKAMNLLLKSNKEYIGIMRLHRDVEDEKVRKICSEFTGEIYQIPPVRSAVKRQLRTRIVHEFEIIEIESRDVLFKVVCDAGTYIRTLINDIGTVFGVGAHMRELRRTRSGTFHEQNAVTLHNLKDAFIYWKENENESQLRAMIQPTETILEQIPQIIVRDSAVGAVCHGANLAVPGILQLDSDITPKKTVAIMTLKGEAVALGTAWMDSEYVMKKREGIAAKIERVFMTTEVYPKAWKSSKSE